MNHQKPSSVIAMLNCCYTRFWRECRFTNCQEILFIVWTHIWSSMLQYHDKWLGSHFGEKLYKFQTDLSVLDLNNHVNSRWATSTKHQLDQRNPRRQSVIRRLEDRKYCFWGSVAGLHRNLSPMRYVVGHFLHVFAYIPLTRVQLFIDKPRPYAQIEIDAGAHLSLIHISEPTRHA